MKKTAIIPFLSLPAVAAAAAPAGNAPQHPNILAIVCEDISPYLGCYGDPVCVSPNLDRFAREEAIRHTRMFTCVGVSAPSRYALITGRYSSNDGANYMRVNKFDKDREAVPPAGVKCFTEYLRAAGYYCTNNSKTDYQFDPPLSAWDESSAKAHWKNGPQDAPFYAVFNLGVTHESQIWANTDLPLTVDPAKVPLPPYYPDNEIVRHDMAVMYSNITRMDEEFQALCDEVKQAGKWDNTIVIWYSDNGGPVPRGKREIMDSGSNVPFMIHFPDRRGAGTVNSNLNMFVDIPATIMALAGLEQPKNIHGKPMYGVQKVEQRKYVFGATDRFDEQVEKRGSIRDSRYLYIRNYMPQQSVYRPNAYRLQMAMMQNMEQLYKEGKLNAVQSLWFNAPASAESLYDCDADPYNINNLAAKPQYASLLKKMRAAYEKEWIAPYNGKWVKYREEDFVNEANPGGVKPQAPKPVAEITNGKLTVVNPSSELSYCYQINGAGLNGNKAHWFLYSKPVDVKPGDKVTLVAVRAGWKNSEKTVVTSGGSAAAVVASGKGASGAILPNTLGAEELVSLNKYAAALSYYNTTPENPSGTKIAYAAYLVEPTYGTDNKPVRIYLRDREGSPDSAVLLTDFESKSDYHYGAEVVWIDDSHLAFMDGYLKTKIISTKPGQKAPLEELAGQVGHNVSNGEILLALPQKFLNKGSNTTEIKGVNCEPGVYKYNRVSGKVTKIMSSEKLFQFMESVLGVGNAGTVAGIDLSHAMFSPGGTKVAVRVELDLKDSKRENKFVVSFDANSRDSDFVIFNANGQYTKPLHQLWFDDDTFLAVDNGVLENKKQVKKWRRDGTYIETLTSTRYTCCHIAFSPLCRDGRRFISSETYYNSDPVSLNIYEYGVNQSPLETLFTLKGLPYTETIWKRNGHIDSSFSVDGSYLYYNKPDAEGKQRIYRRAINTHVS